jgi:putative transposase/transposase-like zinc-binding protein
VSPASAPSTARRARQGITVELADIFRAHGPTYRRTHPLSRAQRRAMHAIERCRTAALGGHREQCDTCEAERLAYNSCRNRHCPKCQLLAKERWLEARRAELLPIPYFHVVFTLPHALNALAQGNSRLIYTLLFRAVAATLTAFGRDPRHLGGDVGVTAVLHTWGQNLSQHLHVHCIVTGGALARDGTRWIPAPLGFLFPVRALAKVLRGKYLAALRRAFATGQLRFAGSTAALASPAAFTAWLADLRRDAWVVYAKAPFAGPAQLLDYLGRYTHRVALSNDRLLRHADGLVHFRWKDYADDHRVKVMALEATEFIRRFLLHVVPDRFVRVRHFGLLANRTRRAKLARCREVLAAPAPAVRSRESVADLMQRLTGIEIDRCPVCHQGRLRLAAILAPTPDWTSPVAILDSS